MTDDLELLRRYAETHAEDAFAEFVRRHINLVYAAALRRMHGDSHGAADVTQQVFAAAARRAYALARHARLTAWLHAATRNAALNIMRNEHRRREREAQTTCDLPITTTAAPNWEHLRPVLDAALDELGEPDREAVLLRYFEERSFGEIGIRLRLNENTARMRVERALDKLRQRLAPHGITSTSAGLALALGQQTTVAAPAGLAASVTSVAVTAAAIGGGAAGSIVLFGLMSTNKLLVGGAAVLAIVGFGSALYRLGDAREFEASAAIQQKLEIAQSNVTALKARLDSVEKDLLEANARVTVLDQELKQAREKSATAATPASVARIATSPWANPDYARAYMEKYRATLHLDYGELFHTLQLRPAQIAEFENVMLEAQQNLVDLWTAAAAEGINTIKESPSSTAIARMTSDPLQSRNDRLKQLLGDPAFEKYKAFDGMHARSGREVVSSLAAAVYASETPLTAPQGEQLLQLIVRNTQTVKTPMADDGKKPLYRLSAQTDWSIVCAQAPAILSGPQISALRDLAERQRLSSEVNRLLNSPPAAKAPAN